MPFINVINFLTKETIIMSLFAIWMLPKYIIIRNMAVINDSNIHHKELDG